MDTSLNTLDWILVALVMFNLWRGWQQGLFRSAVSLAGWVLALILGLKFSASVAPMLAGWLPSGLLPIGGFVVVVLATLIVLTIVASLMASVFKRLRLGWLEKAGGGLLGAVKSLFIMLVLINALAPWLQSVAAWQQSALIGRLQPYAPLAGGLAKDVLNGVSSQLRPANSQDRGSGSADSGPADSATGLAGPDRTINNPF